MTASVQFVFDTEATISLPQMLDTLRGGLPEDGRVTEVTLTALTWRAAGLTLRLSMTCGADARTVTLALTHADTASEAARLAPMTFVLAQGGAMQSVVWHGTTVRIPRATFVAGLAARFGTPSAPVTPRRVSATPRRALRANRPTSRPAVALDAHVLAYEAHMARELRRAPTEAELSSLRASAPRRSSLLTSGADAALQSAELRAASLVFCVTTLVLTSGAQHLI